MSGRIDIYGGADPRDVPMYTVPRAARYIRVSQSTLRDWLQDVIIPPKSGHDERTRYLSFTNVVEAHVLACMRKVYRLKLETVRESIRFLRKHFAVKHPLASEPFKTDGVSLFIERYGKLLDASKGGQAAIREVLEQSLSRVEYADDAAARFFPVLQWTAPSDIMHQPRLVVIDPRRAFGQPSIADTGIAVEVLRDRFQGGDSIRALATDYAISLKAVEEALRAAA